MLRQRALVTLFLLPLFIWFIHLGGWYYSLTITLGLTLSALEYGAMFRKSGLRPAVPLLAGGVATIALIRQAVGFEFTAIFLAALALVSMTWHMIDYERGATRSASDFNVTLAGSLYLGWIGAYLISLRNLPDGKWWVLLVLPTIWLADTAAYFVGSAIGRRRFSPRLSPNKTWEGYLAGVLTGAVAGAGLAAVWSSLIGRPDAELTAITGLGLGLLVSVLAPLGDLAVSMVKRELQVKDSGSLLPGHGGLLDRMDSWLWAGVIGFYFVAWLGTR